MPSPFILIAGGVVPGSLDEISTVLLYNVLEDKIEKGPPMLSPRAQHGMCALRRSVYVVGGCQSKCVQCERFDMDTSTWSEFASEPIKRERHTLVTDGTYLYSCGGREYGVDAKHFTSLCRYDPKADKWEQLCDSPKALIDHCAAVVDGKMYCFGGKANLDLLIYDIGKNSWDVMKNVITKTRTNATMVAIPLLKKMIVVGGIENWNGIPNVDEVNIESNKLQSLSTTLHTARAHHTAVFVSMKTECEKEKETETDKAKEESDRVYVFGGFDGKYVPNAEVLSLNTGEWKPCALNIELQKYGAAVITL